MTGSDARASVKQVALTIVGGTVALAIGAMVLTGFGALLVSVDASCAELHQRVATQERRLATMDVYLNNARVLNTPVAREKAPSPSEYRAVEDELTRMRDALRDAEC